MQKKSKAKMVSFRLSSAEYEAALASCRAHGFRSMSLLARSAFLAFSPEQHSQISYENELTDIRRRLESVTVELNRLTAIVGARVNDNPQQSTPNEKGYAQTNRADVAAP
jgi:hypothetical protein